MALSEAQREKLLNDLKQHRDELRLKMHLGKAEARDEWEKLERKWAAFEHKFDDEIDAVEDFAESATEKVEDTLERAAEEIKKGYQRLRDMLD